MVRKKKLKHRPLHGSRKIAGSLHVTVFGNRRRVRIMVWTSKSGPRVKDYPPSRDVLVSWRASLGQAQADHLTADLAACLGYEVAGYRWPVRAHEGRRLVVMPLAGGVKIGVGGSSHFDWRTVTVTPAAARKILSELAEILGWDLEA